MRRTSSRPHRSVSLLLLVGIGCQACLCGCDATPAPITRDVGSDPLVAVPIDFQVEVLVKVGRKVEPQDRLERRPTHIVLLPDGSLHAAAGKFVVEGARPGIARVLYRDQVAETWGLLNRLDFVGSGQSPSGPVRELGLAETVHVVEITADGQRRRIVKRMVGDQESTATTQLIRTLGGLAWLRDTPPASNVVAPSRYDFGPDPWARYRR